jgi:hypothetical protein
VSPAGGSKFGFMGFPHIASFNRFSTSSSLSYDARFLPVALRINRKRAVADHHHLDFASPRRKTFRKSAA